MVYVILQPRILPGISIDELKKSKKSPTENCIKIGFTINFENRMTQYTSDTPRFDVLYTYEEGTADDEWGLHQLFKEFQVDDLNGKEWFIWNEKIIEFFETNTTIDQIREHIKKPKKAEKERREQIDRLTPLINLIIDLDIDRHLLPSAKEADGVAEKFLWRKRFERLTETLPLDEVDCLKFLEGELEELLYNELLTKYNTNQNRKVDIEKELIEFNTFPRFPDKLQYVFEQGEKMSREKLSLFLSFIPWYFKDYFFALGPDTCKIYCCRKGELEKEYQKQLNNHCINIDDCIYDTFKCGTRISFTKIREELVRIYKESGYEAVVKATDLNDWFKTKLIKMTDKDLGKRVAGYELLKRLK